MTVYEVLTVALITVLAAATIVAIYWGMANWIGAFYVVRCTACHHLTTNSANNPRESCPHCRHPVLTHPIHALAHPGARGTIRVVGDRLRL
jgi:hypothetical protein